MKIDRKQFEQAISEFQLTQYTLGRMAAKLAGARAITYKAARAFDEDERAELSPLEEFVLPAGEGRGFVLTVETVCFEIFREIIRQARQFEFEEALVLAHQDVIELLEMAYG